MSIDKTIPTYSGTVPDKDAQTPSEFNDAADEYVNWYSDQPGHINEWATQANSTASTVNSDKNDAQTYRNEAYNWAEAAVDAAVSDSAGNTGNSAYHHAHYAEQYKNAAQSAVASADTAATSSTSLTIGTGTKSLTVETGKDFVVGMYVIVAYTSSPANYMAGTITSYDSGTGALEIEAATASGSGTYSNWTVSLSGILGSGIQIGAVVWSPDIGSPAFDNNYLRLDGSTIDKTSWSGLTDFAEANNVYLDVGFAVEGNTTESSDSGSVTTEILLGAATDDSTWVAVGVSGTLLYSSDGQSWTESSDSGSVTTGTLYGAATDGSTWVAVGASGTLLCSSDGQSWTASSDSGSVTTENLQNVATDGSTWVVVGNNGTLLCSSDGQSWTASSDSGSVTTESLYGVTTDGSTWVVVGNNGTLLYYLIDNTILVLYKLKASGYYGYVKVN
jgi:hypothetical protein